MIARKVRDLGIYAEVAPSETLVTHLAGRKGIIISGGPASVYDPSSPTIDPDLLTAGIPVLGICYGQQLMAHALGGLVQKGERGEYGLAQLEIVDCDTILRGIEGRQPVWMSHRDLVAKVPEGFGVLASTETCAIAAMDPKQTTILGNYESSYREHKVSLDGFPWIARTFMRPHIEIENDPSVWTRVEALIRAKMLP